MCNNFLQIVSFFVQFLQRELFIVVDMVVDQNKTFEKQDANIHGESYGIRLKRPLFHIL